MMHALWNGVTRRNLFRAGGLLSVAQGWGIGIQKAVAAPLDLSKRLYESIGVRPLVNARGTFTIITGSQTLPEVKRAMDEASRHFVQMDELMDGVGKRLAEITQAPWGIVTAGCCAAITNFTAACIAGFNPERMQQLPDLTGLKNEVIIPAYSRNVYDHAVRMVGVKIVEVKDPSELAAAFTDKTAMVYILGGPGDEGPLGTQAFAAVAKAKNVPIFVDAAAEILTIPNVHLQRGATAVAYSGGKCIRGPQAAGLLLGDKDLLQAAWINSAPHHAFGRSLKVGKEEIMGMLAAVEMWVRRDHKAEWASWEAGLSHIAASAQKVSGVTTKVTPPGDSLSNRSPRLTISWDAAKLGITGTEVSKTLLDGEPRIVVAGATGSRSGSQPSSVSIVPYQMMPGDEKIVADRIHAVLSKPPKFDDPAPVQPPAATVSGQWDVQIDFGRGAAVHAIALEQDGNKLVGTHRGEFYSGDLAGSISGSSVKFMSAMRVHGTRLTYQFDGVLNGDTVAGTVDLGEYGKAKFTGQRHQYRSGNRRG